MPLPDRPVSHASIESVWGQQIHDYTFAPAGCRGSGTGGSVSTTLSKLVYATVGDDPGGYMDTANNNIVVPTGGEGLYSVGVVFNTVSGSAGSGFGTRGVMQLNGTNVATGKEDNNGGTNVAFNVLWVGELAAGDILNFWAQRIGGGTNPTVTVNYCVMYRVGFEFGAP